MFKQQLSALTIICSILCVSSYVQATIVIDSLKKIATYIPKKITNPRNVAIVFDIDNTLATIEPTIGSDTWFYSMFNKGIALQYNASNVLSTLLPTYFAIMEEKQLIPTEDDAALTIKDLQKQQCTVMALTARSTPLRYRTVDQLKSLDIDFTDNIIHESEINLTDLEGKEAYYEHGIICAGLNNKGKLLIHFFEKIGFQPELIIMVDDKLKNIVDVESAAQQKNIPFVGLRYGRLDKTIEQFNLDTTTEELKQFYARNPTLEHIPFAFNK